MPFRTKPITLPVQLHYLKSAYPNSVGDIQGKMMQWGSWVAPSPMSAKYRIDVNYAIGRAPQVWAREPNLREMAGGKKLPHVYEQGAQRLCLYQPAYREWKSTLLISRTIVPWAVLWFYYFEIWLVTGVWPGRGEHPEGDSCVQSTG